MLSLFSKNQANSYKKSNLKVAFWNIDGIFSRISGQRICKLSFPDVASEIKKFDIVCLAETHCSASDILSFEGYSVYQSNRKASKNNKCYGGLAVLIKKGIREGIKILPATNTEIQWLKLSKTYFKLDSDIFLSIVYASPLGSMFLGKDNLDVFETLENDIANYSKSGQCIVCGDFNARTSTQPDYLGDDSSTEHLNFHSILNDSEINRNNMDCSKPDEHGKKLLSLCKSSGLRILNGRTLGDCIGFYTCFSHTGSPSVIDYFLANESLLPEIKDFHVHDPSVNSIHCIISTTIHTSHFESTTNECLKPLPLKYKWGELDSSKFSNAFRSPAIVNLTNSFLSKTSGSSSEDIDNAVGEINNIFQTCASIAKIRTSNKRPHKRKFEKQNKSKPSLDKKWFDSECRNTLNDLKRLASQLRKDPYNVNLIQLYRNSRKTYKRLLRHKRNHFQKNILSQLEKMKNDKPRAFWNLFNDLVELDKSTTSGSQNITASDWVHHFSNLLNKNIASDVEEDNLSLFINDNQSKIFNELSYRITQTEVTKAIKGLKNGKSCGVDGILNEMIKASNPEVVPLLVKLFNSIFSSGYYPSAWRLNLITPLHKRGSKDNPENYRGIAVSSHLSKLFCGILHRRLSDFVQRNKVVPNNQIGFKANSRTSDHIFVLKSIIDKYLNKLPRKYLFCCFIDFKSAFDTVWRKGLLYKLLRADIGGNFFVLLKNMYSDTKYSIRTKHGLSDDFTSNVGIKQGCVLSPLLFNIYLSDLPNIFDVSCGPITLFDTTINCLLYADDLILLSDSALGLQNSLDKLNEYCKKWKLSVNIKKTKVMIFNKGGCKIKRYSFNIDNNEIEVIQNYCYLGINFCSAGTFKLALNNLHDKAKKALFKLKQFDLRDSINTAFKLFNSLILPILRYGSEVWAPFQFNGLNDKNIVDLCDKMPIENINNSFCKYLLGVNKYASNYAAKGELGSWGFGLDCVYNAIKYWLRICDYDKDSLLYKSYLENIQNYRRRKTSQNWCTHVKNILQQFDLLSVWENQGAKYKKKILRILRSKMHENYEKCWRRHIFESGKLRTYRLFKCSFSLEKYITFSKFKDRKNFSKLRISTHKLHIETGRHQRPQVPSDMRFCEFCSNFVEDEMHFVLDCSKYEKERKMLFSSLSSFDLNSKTRDDLFVFLMSYDGVHKVLKPVLNYINSAFLSRFPHTGT
ncbi:MAG: reverse transcriptase family protein [Candidatus Omnitrophica bacterium]|nr:reverse transcriptase family protein [Candidatus Omnitrophota bacterium]